MCRAANLLEILSEIVKKYLNEPNLGDIPLCYVRLSLKVKQISFSLKFCPAVALELANALVLAVGLVLVVEEAVVLEEVAVLEFEA